MRKHALLSAFIIIVNLASAQTPKEFLSSALTVYGPYQNLETFSYQLKGSRNAGAQGKTYNSGEKQLYYNKKIFDYKNRQAFEQNTNTFAGGYVFNFANLAKDTIIYNWDIDQNRLGKTLNRGGPAQAKQIYNFRDIQNAYYRVKELEGTTDSLILLSSEKGPTRIQRNRKDKGPLVYSFDETNKLISVEAPTTKEKQLFLDYVASNGYTNASRIQAFINDALVSEEQLGNWQYNFTPDHALFQLPVGYTPAIRDSSSITPISKDIYLIDKIGGDRNVLFVNMDDFVAVIEAPLTAEASKDIINRIRQTIPGKPIKYVFTTHFHSDHTGGLRQYAVEDVTLVMAQKTSAYVADLMKNKQPDDFTKGGKQPSIQTFTGKMVLKDANHLIEFYEVPNSHADGMAMVYFPTEKIIYQGDLLSVPLDGSLPYAIDVIKEMDQFIKANNLFFNRMIGHHGHNNITPDLLRQILNYKKQVVY